MSEEEKQIHLYMHSKNELGLATLCVEKDKEIERLNKCIDEALEIIIKDWNDKCTIPIHSVVDTGDDIRIKLYYQLFFKGVDKE